MARTASPAPVPPPGPGELPDLPALLESVLSIGSDITTDATLQRVVDQARSLTGSSWSVLAVLDLLYDSPPELWVAGHEDRDLEQATELAQMLDCSYDGLLGLLGNAEDPVPFTAPGVPGQFLGLRVLVDEAVYALLCVAHEDTSASTAPGAQGTPFEETGRQALKLVAAHGGIALANAQLYETAYQREHWITGTAAVTNALLTGREGDDAMAIVAEQAMLLADADAGVVLQPADEGTMIVVTAAGGRPRDDLIGTQVHPGPDVFEQLLNGEPVFLDASEAPPSSSPLSSEVRARFGPCMLLPLEADGRLIGTLALPRGRGARPYTHVERLLATQFASQAALALVLGDMQRSREQLAVFEDRDRIARDLHDLVVQRLFATSMMLESTQRKTGEESVHTQLGRAVDELGSTIQEVRTTIFTLQQPPADAPTTFRGLVLRETAGASAVLGFQPSVHFSGALDHIVGEQVTGQLLSALRHALAVASRRTDVSRIEVNVAAAPLTDGRPGVLLRVHDNGRTDGGGSGEAEVPGATTDRSEAGTTVTWRAPL